MTDCPRELYLKLLKETLTFSLWEEPPIPIDPRNHSQKLWKNRILNMLAVFLKRYDLHLCTHHGFDAQARLEGRGWPGYADTMIGRKRLDNLQDCIEKVLRDNVPGDFIETGVWRGGSCIFMRGVLKAHDDNQRKIYVADSFEGLPDPNEEKYPADAGDPHSSYSALVVSKEQVERNFQRYGLLDQQVCFLKGWFSESLPSAPISKLAILRLDGDMYESTMDALQSLYSKLSIGGFCIVDDYALPGCKKAITDFREQNGIESEIHTVDWTGRFWRKEE